MYAVLNWLIKHENNSAGIAPSRPSGLSCRRELYLVLSCRGSVVLPRPTSNCDLMNRIKKKQVL
jgi:hypothetical protein